MPDEWTSLEITKLAVGVAAPIMVLIVGVVINRNVSRNLQTMRTLVEKRIAVFDEMAEHYNLIYTFMRYIGPWKENDPASVIAAKRHLDNKCFVSAWVFEGNVVEPHEAFMRQCFDMYRGGGRDAGIRNRTARYKAEHPRWDASWEACFTTDGLDDDHLDEVEERYNAVMSAFTKEFNPDAGSRPFVSGEARRLRV